jgi:hypothetical protein
LNRLDLGKTLIPEAEGTKILKTSLQTYTKTLSMLVSRALICEEHFSRRARSSGISLLIRDTDCCLWQNEED